MVIWNCEARGRTIRRLGGMVFQQFIFITMFGDGDAVYVPTYCTLCTICHDYLTYCDAEFLARGTRMYQQTHLPLQASCSVWLSDAQLGCLSVAAWPAPEQVSVPSARNPGFASKCGPRILSAEKEACSQVSQEETERQPRGNQSEPAFSPVGKMGVGQN